MKMICYWNNNCLHDIKDPLSHFAEHLKEKTDFNCEWKGCSVHSSKSKFKLMQHLLRHVEPKTKKARSAKTYPCVCGTKFTKKSDRSSHYKVCQIAFNDIVHHLFIGLPH